MAKALILFFSQCGHTKILAERICAKLQAAGMNSDLIEITEGKPSGMDDYKIVFIGSPVYYYREPLIWEEYIKSLPDMTGKAGFIFSTHGAEKKKHVDKIMNDNLSLYFARKGLKILSADGTVCEDTWTPLKKAGMGFDRPNQDDMKGFDEYIERVISDYKSGKVDRAIYDFSLKNRKHKLGNWFWKLFIRICPKPHADNNVCTKCSLCVQRCPANNIELNDSLKIHSDCIKCYECERVCKSNGIKVNWKLIDAFVPKK
jgi:flavodoxin/NAD-dependent dihydropyrimidine dehydrogenase PreA subunit